MKTACLLPCLFLLTNSWVLADATGQAGVLPQSPLSASIRSVNFGKVAIHATSAPQIVDLKNSGPTAVLVQRLFTSSEEFTLTQNCNTGKALPSGDRCTITVTFTPQETGSHKGVITVLVQDAGLMNIALTGNGVESDVVLSGNHIVFHDQLVNTRGDMQMLRFENRGTAPVSIKNVSVSAGFTLLPTRDQCSASEKVGPKGSCNFAVCFAPQTDGLLSGSITIDDSDNASPHRVGLSGRATAIKLSTSSLMWNNTAVGATGVTQDLQVSNEGISAVRVDGIDARGDFAEHNNCGKELAPHQSCVVSVVFDPKSVGKASGSIRIHDSDVTGIQTVFLNGNGVALELSPAKIDFGQQEVGKSGAAESVVITNHGATNADLRSIGVNGDFVMPSKSCGDALAAAQSCKVSLSFSPTTTGPRAGRLAIDTGHGDPESVELSGVGLPEGKP